MAKQKLVVTNARVAEIERIAQETRERSRNNRDWSAYLVRYCAREASENARNLLFVGPSDQHVRDWKANGGNVERAFAQHADDQARERLQMKRASERKAAAAKRAARRAVAIAHRDERNAT